jgi:hypothetical protein
MPFFSWQWINIERYPALLRGAITSGEKGAVSRTAGVLGKAAVVKSASVAAAATLRIGAMYTGYWLWNNLVHPDEEDKLGNYDKANPHVILGSNPDGSVVVFRNVGALGDFLEWFGLNDITQDLRAYSRGQMSMKDMLANRAKAPVNKAIGSIRPDLKAVFEVPAGVSSFPDIFNPRTMEAGEMLASTVGLQDEYKWVKGKILDDGGRPRDHYWQRWLFGVSDPRKNALSEMYDLRAAFLKKKGIESGGIYPISQFKNAREAAWNEDYQAFRQWQDSYLKGEGRTVATTRKFKAFLGRLDPIAATLNKRDEAEFTGQFLNSEQRTKLAIARTYSHNLKTLLWTWWVTGWREGDKTPGNGK